MKLSRVASVSRLALLITLLLGTLSPLGAQDFAKVVERVRPSVALVFVEEPDGSFGSGTGFIVAGSSLLVTAGHVVETAKNIVIRYSDGAIYEAKLVLLWHEKDVALLKVEKGRASNLALRMSPVRVGEQVIVIGYPLVEKLGISQVSVTQGIVSALRGEALQLSISVNPGNSGGPVIDSSGQVIGVIVGTLEGSGFALASHWKNVKEAFEAASRGSLPIAISLAGGNAFVTGWIELGTLTVEAKQLATLLKGSVIWDPSSRSLILAVSGKRLVFTEGSRYMDVDGKKIVLPVSIRPDHRVPLKPVVETLGGKLEADLRLYTATVHLPGLVAQGKAPSAASPRPAAPGAPTVDLGAKELWAGVGTTSINFGISFGELSKMLGAPDRREIWNRIPGLLNPPVAVYYTRFGLMALLVEGNVWGLGALSTDWVLADHNLRVGDPLGKVEAAVGHGYERNTSGNATLLWYKDEGVAFLLRGDSVVLILVFSPY